MINEELKNQVDGRKENSYMDDGNKTPNYDLNIRSMDEIDHNGIQLENVEETSPMTAFKNNSIMNPGGDRSRIYSP